MYRRAFKRNTKHSDLESRGSWWASPQFRRCTPCPLVTDSAPYLALDVGCTAFKYFHFFAFIPVAHESPTVQSSIHNTFHNILLEIPFVITLPQAPIRVGHLRIKALKNCLSALSARLIARHDASALSKRDNPSTTARDSLVITTARRMRAQVIAQVSTFRRKSTP